MATGGTYYVNTNSAGGDGTTRALTGTNAAFASLQAAESALQGNLTSDLIILCAGGQDGGCRFAGWTTSSSARIIVRGDPAATAGDGKNDGYFFDTNYYYDSSSSKCMDIWTDFVTFDGIQISMVGSGNNTQAVSHYGLSSSADIVIKNCKVYRGITGYLCQGVTTGPGTWTVENCLFDWTRPGGGDQFHDRMIAIVASSTFYGYNNTMGVDADKTDTNDPTGILINAGANVEIHNNAIFVNGGNCMNISTGGTINISYNAADQNDDSAGHQDISPGGTYSTDMNAAFTSWGSYGAGNDWSIKDSSSVLYNNGTTGGPSTDQNGVTFSTQDIGCFAFVPAGGSGGGSIPAPLLLSGMAA